MLPPGSFVIACDIDNGQAMGQCIDAFQDAGGGGVVVVIATPSPGSMIGPWTGCTSVVGGLGQTCAMSFPGGVPLTFDITATFLRISGTITVTVDGSGNGAGRIVGNGGALPAGAFVLDCTVTAGVKTGSCQDTFDNDQAGGMVSLQATPNAGSTFTGWTGCPSPSGSTCTLTFAPFETRSFNVSGGFSLITPAPGTITVIVDGLGTGAGGGSR